MAEVGVKVEGIAEVAKNLRKLDADLPKGLGKVHKGIAEPIAEEAHDRAPVRSGALANSVRAGGSQKAAIIRAGGARIPYAPVVHYGGYPGDYPGQPFLTDTMTAAAPGLAADYEALLWDWIESVWVDSNG